MTETSPETRKHPEALDFLLTRRSRPAKTLGKEAPSRAEIETLLIAGARVPDHGRVVPWRFLVMTDSAKREKLAEEAATHLAETGHDPAKVEKDSTAFLHGGVMVAVISAPVEPHRIPRWEQEASAAAVCLSLLNAALAAGWGANWLTGPLARDEDFLRNALGCAPGETIAGFIHIGNEQVRPGERERPDVEAITSWI